MAAMFYAGFLLNPANGGDLIPYLLLLLAETISMFQLIGSWWTILAGINHHPDQHRYEAERERLLSLPAHASQIPTIDVFVTVYGEAIDVVRKTVTAARDMSILHLTYILDDGHSPAIESLAQELGVYYISRPSHEHAKAGNLNYALTYTDGEYVAIFDADHVPSPTFLEETMPFFWNKNLAFVQTPQHYENLNGYIATGSAETQDLFYSLICPGKNRFNSVFWVGTNAVFSRKALGSVGGVYRSNSEDIWTSYLLHQKGWQSVFLPKVLAIGKAPETAEAYLKQQLRWAAGGFEIFFRANPLLMKGKLTTDQKIQYLLTTTYYFTGLAVAILILLPVLYLFFDIIPIHAQSSSWLIHFLPYFLAQFILIYHVKGRVRWQVIALSMATFPIYIKAMWNVLLNKQHSWQVTNKAGGSKRAGFHTVLNQVCCAVVMVTAASLALLINTPSVALFISVTWTFLNVCILGRLIIETLPSRSISHSKDQPVSLTLPTYETTV